MTNNYSYHPKEVSFCGYSGSGKTTIICEILDELKSKYKIGYIKHDAHNFQMDKPGKDTYKARKSGANTIFISNKSEYAIIGNSPINNEIVKKIFQDFDFVIVEGHKKTPLPKILMLNDQEGIIDLIKNINIDGLLAFCGKEPLLKPEILESLPNKYDLVKSLPYFQRDDIKNISRFILKKVQTLFSK